MIKSFCVLDLTVNKLFGNKLIYGWFPVSLLCKKIVKKSSWKARTCFFKLFSNMLPYTEAISCHISESNDCLHAITVWQTRVHRRCSVYDVEHTVCFLISMHIVNHAMQQMVVDTQSSMLKCKRVTIHENCFTQQIGHAANLASQQIGLCSKLPHAANWSCIKLCHVEIWPQQIVMYPIFKLIFN